MSNITPISSAIPMPDSSGSSTAPMPRNAKGHFQSGPGNPGRPVGSKNKFTQETLTKVRALTPIALEKLEAALRAGEKFAIEYVLNRTLPQGRTVEFHGTTPSDVTEALASGEISTTEAKEISATIAKLKEINDLEEMRDRLAHLEELLKQQSR